jgi:hypothetical protein
MEAQRAAMRGGAPAFRFAPCGLRLLRHCERSEAISFGEWMRSRVEIASSRFALLAMTLEWP